MTEDTPDLHNSTQRLNTLRELALEIARADELETLSALVLRGVLRHFGCGAAALHLGIDQHTQHALFTTREADGMLELPTDPHLAWQSVLDTGTAMTVRSSSPGTALALGGRPLSSWSAAPIQVERQPIGVLLVGDLLDDLWRNEDELDLLAIAALTASTYRRIRLLNTSMDLEKHVAERTSQLERLYEQQAALAESERQARRLAETLREAGAIVAAKLKLGCAIDELLNQIGRVVPHDSASVQLLEEDELLIVGGDGWVVEKGLVGYRFPIPGPNPNTRVILTKQPVILNYDELAEYAEFQKSTHGEILSWLGVPLISHERAIGMLTLDSREKGVFTEQQANLSIALADQVAVAIEQAILFERTQAALNERDALRAIIADITDELDLGKLLGSVLVRACELLDAGSGEIGLLCEDVDMIEIVAAHNMGESVVNSHIPIGQGAIGQTAAHIEARIIDDYSRWEHALPAYQDTAWQAVMAVPLTYHKRLVGVIAVADRRPDKSFSISDLELFKMFADQASIAIENARLFRRVQQLATTDDLTGLANRRELFRIGGELVNRARAGGQPLAAVMLDIDLFKEVNDTHGHNIGDQVLAGLAELFRLEIRQSDLIARYGGEEFILLLPETDYKTALSISERLRDKIENTPIDTARGALHVTLSFGVALLADRHESIASLIDSADAAMYAAKAGGRNRVEGAL